MAAIKMKQGKLTASALLVDFLLVGSFYSLIPVNAASTTLNNVQVLVQTTNTNINSYALTAYNSSGYQVASSTNMYPGFGLELPSGTYLITVTATQQGTYYPLPIAYSTGAVSNSSNAVISPPIKAPVTEYGYVLQTVSGPVTLNVKTTPMDNVATSQAHVKISYVNGTGAAGVWVYASVVGGYYNNGLNKAVMENQTVAGGSTTLTVPALPILLQAYISVPINVPKTTTMTTATVGGQPVNVTMYWQPNYVGLTGSALIIPPQTNAQITLHVQQYNYYVEPYTAGGVQTGVATTTTMVAATTVSGVPSGAPSNSTAPAQIPPFEGQLGGDTLATSTSTGPAQINFATIALIATIIAIAAIAGTMAFRFRRHV